MQTYVLELADFEANVPHGDDNTYLYRLQNVDKSEFKKIIESRCVGIYIHFKDKYEYLSTILYLYASLIEFDDDNQVKRILYFNTTGDIRLYVQRDSQGCNIYLKSRSELGLMIKNDFVPTLPMSS